MAHRDTGSAAPSAAGSAKLDKNRAPFDAVADQTTLPVFADLLEYPGPGWETLLKNCRTDKVAPDFCSAVESSSLSEVQELYTRTFDLNPACALEVGYHLFGENYKRGEFLAGLRETEASFELRQSQQLPDYLPVLLRLVTKLDDEELRASLIVECMIPAIDKMLSTFTDPGNSYRSLLEEVTTTLRSECGVVAAETVDSSIPIRASLPVLNTTSHVTPPELF